MSPTSGEYMRHNLRGTFSVGELAIVILLAGMFRAVLVRGARRALTLLLALLTVGTTASARAVTAWRKLSTMQKIALLCAVSTLGGQVCVYTGPRRSFSTRINYFKRRWPRRGKKVRARTGHSTATRYRPSRRGDNHYDERGGPSGSYLLKQASVPS